MRAVVIEDGELALRERPDLTPGPGEVLVSVRAAGLNAADLLQRRGFYPAPPGWPIDVPGLELAGEVRGWGHGVTGLHVGQRVCAVVGGGAQATHCVLPAQHLIHVPPGIEITTAGGFAEGFVTSYDALVRQAHLEVGERVAITGAAGGVGTSAVQLARALGATVVAVTRDEVHHDRLRSLGASECVTIDQLSDIDPVDVVMELLGAVTLSTLQHRLRPFARVVVIGVPVGSKVDIDLLGVMTRRATITGSTLRARSNEEKAQIAAAVNHDVGPLWARDAVHTVVNRTFPLSEVAAAYDYFAQPGKFGKVILTTA